MYVQYPAYVQLFSFLLLFAAAYQAADWKDPCKRSIVSQVHCLDKSRYAYYRAVLRKAQC